MRMLNEFTLTVFTVSNTLSFPIRKMRNLEDNSNAIGSLIVFLNYSFFRRVSLDLTTLALYYTHFIYYRLLTFPNFKKIAEKR